MTPEQAGMLARVDERTKNTDSNLNNHIQNDDDRFERTFTYVKESFDKMEVHLASIDDKLGTLWDNNNRHEGAFGIGKWVAGMVGGSIVALIDFLANTHGGSKP